MQMGRYKIIYMFGTLVLGSDSLILSDKIWPLNVVLFPDWGLNRPLLPIRDRYRLFLGG